MNGFLLIDKPAGKTSFDVCFKVRKALGIKRVGHTGTLDPFATGLLVIAVGKATKLIPYLDKAQKTYVTTIKLGAVTETLDTESQESVLHDIDPRFTKEYIQDVISTHFTGSIEQVPPKYSALKIDGKRAYDLARDGQEVVMKKRPAFVHNCKVLEYKWPYVTCELTVAAGFYVRSFARDLGYELLKDLSGAISDLEAGGYCVTLRRTIVGDLTVKKALGLEDLNSKTILQDPRKILNMMAIELQEKQLKEVSFGRAFECIEDFGQDDILLLKNGETVGLGRYKKEEGIIQPKIVFF